jgi:hypothetical protein
MNDFYKYFGKFENKKKRIILDGRRNRVLLNHFLDGFREYENQIYYNFNLQYGEVTEILRVIRYWIGESKELLGYFDNDELYWYCSDDFKDHLLDTVEVNFSITGIRYILY